MGFLGWAVTVTAGLMSYPIDTVQEDDDDLRGRSQVQGIPGLFHPGGEERGLHVSHEGRWCEHPERSGWSRCVGRLRQVQGGLHRLQNRQIGWSIATILCIWTKHLTSLTVVISHEI